MHTWVGFCNTHLPTCSHVDASHLKQGCKKHYTLKKILSFLYLNLICKIICQIDERLYIWITIRTDFVFYLCWFCLNAMFFPYISVKQGAWSLFSHYSQMIHHSSPVRARYGVIFVSSKFELCFFFAIAKCVHYHVILYHDISRFHWAPKISYEYAFQ